METDIAQEKFGKVSQDKALSVREYFWTLRLAILRVDRKQVISSVEIAKYPMTKEIWECATRIAQAL